MCTSSKEVSELLKAACNSHVPLDTALFICIGLPFWWVGVSGFAFGVMWRHYADWIDRQELEMQKLSKKKTAPR
jgi:hypothetical protein